MEKFILALALQPIFCIFMEFVVQMSIYVCQEINHTVRKIINEIKSIWRVV
jgi:hypothetical protein